MVPACRFEAGTMRFATYSTLQVPFAEDWKRQLEGSLGKTKIRDCTCGLIVTIVGLGLYSYYVRELLTALTIFSVIFAVLALPTLSALLIWYASVQVAAWAKPASLSVIAYSRRRIAPYVHP